MFGHYVSVAPGIVVCVWLNIGRGRGTEFNDALKIKKGDELLYSPGFCVVVNAFSL